MSRKMTTLFIIAIGAVVWIGWDIIVAINDTPGDTISEIVLEFSIKWWILPWAFGVLIGHLFWPGNHLKYFTYWGSKFVLIISGLVLLLLNALIIECTDFENDGYLSIIMVIVGILWGRALWPQERI